MLKKTQNVSLLCHKIVYVLNNHYHYPNGMDDMTMFDVVFYDFKI